MLQLLLDYIAVLCTLVPPIVTDQVTWFVGLSFSEPWNNGWSDRDAFFVEDTSGPRETPITYKCKKTAVYTHTVNGDGSKTAKIIKKQC